MLTELSDPSLLLEKVAFSRTAWRLCGGSKDLAMWCYHYRRLLLEKDKHYFCRRRREADPGPTTAPSDERGLALPQ